MLYWHARPYLIDHGAALTFQHAWTSPVRPYDARNHALLTSHPDLDTAEAALAPLVTETSVGAAVAEVPAEWLADDPHFGSADDARRAYVDALMQRYAARAGLVAR
jgi:hypothetical protein